MKLHNTLTRSVDTFTPLSDDSVRIYSCGPTVYDNIHIGNLSAFVAADTLRRALALEYKVRHVMNFTDIDDKTISRSKIEFPDLEPMAALKALTIKYGDIFLQDMKAIGNSTDEITFILATDAIEQMKRLITNLYADGFAYVTEDGVYFSIQKYQESGKKYGQLTEVNAENTSTQRIQNDEYDKDSVHDFALWKIQKEGEPAWDFELAGHILNGRPGWHIECSAMSTDSLGLPFDIHTGGVDLIFPHHENEIAQSTAGQSTATYAQYFVHNEHLLVEGRKMSKSLKNFYTLRDIQDKGYEPLAFRVVVLQSHYLSRTNFSWESLEAAQNRLQAYRLMADLALQPSYDTQHTLNTSEFFTEKTNAIRAAILNDLDTPTVLALLSEVEAQISAQYAVFTDAKAYETYNSLTTLVDSILGLQLKNRVPINLDQQKLIDERTEARNTKNWQRSDILRDELSSQGIGLSDTPLGTLWYRI